MVFCVSEYKQGVICSINDLSLASPNVETLQSLDVKSKIIL